MRRDGVVVATVPGGATTWVDGALKPGRTYQWTVQALDAAGNRSAQSTPAGATTPTQRKSTKLLLADLRTAPEHQSGWSSSRFPGWTDADGDRCLTPSEVFLAEAVTAPRMTAGCGLIAGKWSSMYDGRTVLGDAGLTVDHLVGLREAWRSGAWAWSRPSRRALANDLGYPSTLVAVSRTSAAAKKGREPQDWLPHESRCSYLSQWVAVKWRWGLAVDPTERRFLSRRLDSCGWPYVQMPGRPRAR